MVPLESVFLMLTSFFLFYRPRGIGKYEWRWLPGGARGPPAARGLRDYHVFTHSESTAIVLLYYTWNIKQLPKLYKDVPVLICQKYQKNTCKIQNKSQKTWVSDKKARARQTSCLSPADSIRPPSAIKPPSPPSRSTVSVSLHCWTALVTSTSDLKCCGSTLSRTVPLKRKESCGMTANFDLAPSHMPSSQTVNFRRNQEAFLCACYSTSLE